MSSVAAIQEGASGIPPQSSKKKKKISWEAFQQEYLTREDGFKYEWLDGIVEKTKRTMDYTQFRILRAIRYFFDELKNTGKVKGLLISEGDTFFKTHHRRPDIAYYTDEQIDRIEDGKPPVPQFIIEVISKNDKIRKVNEKMDDYRKADVLVIWQIYPNSKKVHVCIGTKINIYEGNETISAAPVLPEFEIKVADIFK